ncbi:MAG: hypothetical protein J7J92_03905 [Candidatus Aenigmarchaeota archaeon]|nr:hypothetical protein [Candidatus Aenigmarchaeota archaeon]
MTMYTLKFPNEEIRFQDNGYLVKKAEEEGISVGELINRAIAFYTQTKEKTGEGYLAVIGKKDINGKEVDIIIPPWTTYEDISVLSIGLPKIENDCISLLSLGLPKILD